MKGGTHTTVYASIFLSMIHEKELQKEKRGTAGNKGENMTEESAVSPVEEMTQREVVPNLKVHWS